jgi:hypothetical protein
MVDRQARNEALQALRRFLRCETTNDEYESEYPLPVLFGRKESKDPAIKVIHGMSWNWFDDFNSHKLEEKYELDPETKQVAERCCVFLDSDCEYEWRETNFIQTGFTRSVLTTLGLIRTTPTLEERIANHLDQPEGDAAVWPFFRQSDYLAATQKLETITRN